MVVLRVQSEFGHAPPPQTPYSIISNLPGWELGKRVRDGDMAPLARVVHIYPRFAPTQFAGKLAGEITKLLGVEGKGAFMYLNPGLWSYSLRHITSPHREDKVMKPEDVMLRVVDIAGHRLYVVLYNMQQTPGVMLTWGNPGLGVSIRGAELLLKGVDSMKEVQVDQTTEVEGDAAAAAAALPEPTWTPETEAHQGIKERVVELLHRAPQDPEKIKVSPSDVFLYPTGMGAIFHTSNQLLDYRPGTIVVAGVVFHNTYHHLVEECPHGWRHAGKVDKAGLDDLEAWLEGETKAGRPVSYLLVEFPGNPTLNSPDLSRLKKMSEVHGFVLIVDDTIAGFANVDVLPYCDILLTSLTKSFSGLADVMGGSIVLNPLSSHYEKLSSLWTAQHRNEFFAPDAEVLLSNSREFISRTKILNRNAEAVAGFLNQYVSSTPASPVARVLYPTLLPDKSVYDRFKTTPTDEFPEPGYGCLLSVDFDSIDSAKTFYDNCGFYPSPHLGGHVTIMFAYNMFVFSKGEEREYFRTLGVREECVRISVGLEDVEDLIDTIKDALKVVEASRKGTQTVAAAEEKPLK